ncbi:MAG TPA: benzoate-CoA ligase family protein, partial [Rhizobiales bacterium]|nr:benzoate-CoA ligase family protein [Hyphomicrobiales bacterium]
MSDAGWYNAVCDFVDANVDKGFGAKPAFIDPERSLTYQQLQIASKQLANVLGKLGIERERRIGLLLFDTVDFPTVFWGALRAGVVPVCMNTLLTADQCQYMLDDSRAETLFIAAPLLEIIGPVLSRLEFVKHVIVVGGQANSHGWLCYEDLLADASDEFKTVKTCGDETAFWLYSSGSTGDPKGVRHVHTSLMYVAHHYGKNLLGIKHDDVCFAAAKLFFAYGLGAGMGVSLSVGATTVLLPDRPTPTSVLHMLKTYNPTLFFGVPTLYAAMLADDNCQPENGSSRLRLCISAGEALPSDVGLSWKERMGVDIIDGIGSTEMLHVFLTNRPDDIRYGTSGREFDGYKLRLVDDDGKDVGVEEIGELLVSGGSAADGYWNKREKSRATFAGIWTHTGDKYYRDDEGYYHYCGRTDDMFKVSGRWVSPFEVEEALISHAAVLEAAVVAKRDDEGLIK